MGVLPAVSTLLTEAAYLTLTGSDGAVCPVWRNPSQAEFVRGLSGATHATTSLRGMLTERDLFVWQGSNMVHGHFVRLSGIDDGIRLGLRRARVEVNDETVVAPEAFAWVFGPGDHADVEIERQRAIVEQHLRGSQPLRTLYPEQMAIDWYL